MRLGVRQGARGADVARLHRVLGSAGFGVDPGEISREEFGPSTLDALHALLRGRGLPVVDEIDRSTLEVLIEIEQNITINIDEGGTKPAPKPDETHGKVTGTLVDGDGAPVVSTKVALFSEQLRSETQLGEGQTNAKGAYSFRHRRHAALNLLVRALSFTWLIARQARLYHWGEGAERLVPSLAQRRAADPTSG